MAGPPPWTITGFMPTYLSSTMSRANSSRRTGSVIAAPPYLMTTVRPWNSRMYGRASRRASTSRIRSSSAALHDSPHGVQANGREVVVSDPEVHAAEVAPQHLVRLALGVELREQPPALGATRERLGTGVVVAGRVPGEQAVGRQLNLEVH